MPNCSERAYMDVKDIRKIVIAGAGTMGYSMADRFASYGF